MSRGAALVIQVRPSPVAADAPDWQGVTIITGGLWLCVQPPLTWARVRAHWESLGVPVADAEALRAHVRDQPEPGQILTVATLFDPDAPAREYALTARAIEDVLRAQP